MSTLASNCEFVGGPFDGHVCDTPDTIDGRHSIVSIPVNRHTMRDPRRRSSWMKLDPVVVYQLRRTGTRWQYCFLGFRRTMGRKRLRWWTIAARSVRRLLVWKWKQQRRGASVRRFHNLDTALPLSCRNVAASQGQHMRQCATPDVKSTPVSRWCTSRLVRFKDERALFPLSCPGKLLRKCFAWVWRSS